MAVDKEMEAVFKSSRAETDPVSGNEVPTGSLPEEVRDDIPAQLSEGEYVVPADVVRYYGVKFFEDLRNEAKSGWSDMEANGRIGGDPVGMEMGQDELPFDISELEVVEAAEGAYISGYDEGGMAAPLGYKGGTGVVEVKQFVGPDGQIIFVQFMNGIPLTAIPQGYKEADTAAEQVAEAVVQPVQQGDDGPDTPKPEAKPAIDWSSPDLSIEDYENYAKQRDSFLNKAVTGGAALFGGPLIGGLASLAQRHQDKRFLSGLEKRMELANEEQRARLQGIYDGFMATRDVNEDGKLDNIIERSGIFGGEGGLTENLTDIDQSGEATFGDTWLGDLLGLDGQAGVQGPSLKASRAGARRGRAYKPAINDNDGTNESDNSSNAFASAATGTTTITNSDGNTSNVTTYDTDKVKEIGYNPGGR